MSTTACFAPVAAATRQTLTLAMQRLWLTGQVLPAGARLMVQHVFQSQESAPLEVIYCFPLPRDAALRRFRVTGDGFEAHSELQPTDTAVKTYEAGIASGALSTLARQYGDGLVNLTVGNIRPQETITVHLEILCGVELRDDGLRFRFPFTLAPSYHAQATTALTAPGEGEIELPPNQFGDLILPRFREDATGLHSVGFELSLVAGLGLQEVGSPSHTVKVRQDTGGHSASITLNAERDIPNRDLVLDARFQSIAPQVLAGKRHFAAIIPSTTFGSSSEAPRRVVILLDRSGSMQGEPISQARKAISACLGALSETDMFGLIAFNQSALHFRASLVPGTRSMRDEAQEFLTKTEVSGGTELVQGFRQAAALFEGSGGDILILTDGQVSGTEQILASARATGVRLHCLGIGSASQDRFLTLLSRETGGVSRFVTPRERVDLSAVDLFASIGRPVAAELKAGANIQPPPPSFVFAGTPVLLFGEASEGKHQIDLTWTGGSLTLPVDLSADDRKVAETVHLLQGARLITDWESRYPSTDALQPLEKRKENRIAARLLALSESYGLASREMSLVSVLTRSDDRSGELPETRIVPVGMPQDNQFAAYFARRTRPSEFTATLAVGDMSMMPAAGEFTRMFAMPGSALPAPAAMAPAKDLPSLMSKVRVGSPSPHHRGNLPLSPEDSLLELASRLESDGGMPGKNPESRAGATVLAILAFLSQGHTQTQGAFRSHVARLVSFLKSQNGLPSHAQQVVPAVIEFAARGASPKGEWLTPARDSQINWKAIEKALQ